MKSFEIDDYLLYKNVISLYDEQQYQKALNKILSGDDSQVERNITTMLLFTHNNQQTQVMVGLSTISTQLRDDILYQTCQMPPVIFKDLLKNGMSFASDCLIDAVQHGHLENVQSLLKAGYDSSVSYVSEHTQETYDLIDVAIKVNSSKKIDSLINAGCKIEGKHLRHLERNDAYDHVKEIFKTQSEKQRLEKILNVSPSNSKLKL